MNTFLRRFLHPRRNRGQMLITFVFFLIVLILFVGLGIDVGFAYITKANLSKAVDAAALVGVRNLMDQQVQTIVQSAFAMNYGRPGRDTGTVVPTVTIVTDTTTNTRRLQVSATATINTFFIRVLPTWRTVTVRANAETQRGRAILGLVLDRSGSMSDNGGWQGLPPGVDTFIDLFDDTIDRAALVTYATTVRTDLAMTQPFKAQVKSRVPRLRSQYEGATFSHGGIEAGYAQVVAAPVLTGENVTRAIVFFTDGRANMIKETVNCPPTRELMFGGSDSGNSYWVMPSNSDSTTLCQASGVPSCCGGFTRFTSVNGGTLTPTATNIREEGRDRAIAVAKTAQAGGIFVYSIGYGNNVDLNFLREIANDPASPTFDSDLPSGKALQAGTPQAIRDAFQIIAAAVLERLTQ
ncbi:MAG: hypothetical protein PCFJNLEI_03719 [Verrucomicrobiae bacterium]|nr:hypothetical protein [Verrucomicrobiae bacterium]